MSAPGVDQNDRLPRSRVARGLVAERAEHCESAPDAPGPWKHLHSRSRFPPSGHTGYRVVRKAWLTVPWEILYSTCKGTTILWLTSILDAREQVLERCRN